MELEEERMKADSKKERKILVNTKGTPISNKKNREKIEEKLKEEKTSITKLGQKKNTKIQIFKRNQSERLRENIRKIKKMQENLEEKLSCQKTPVIRKEQLKYPQSPIKVIKIKEEKEKQETPNSLARVKNPHRKTVKKKLFREQMALDEEMREAEERWEGLENALAQHED